MKSDRLLSSILLLQARGRMSSADLAERLEVSPRTVHRDMESLAAAGVPVFATRGALGGWQLDEHWRTRVPGLDGSELRALMMAQPRTFGDPRLAASAERAMTKLLAALPPTLRDQAATIRERLYVDPTGWHGTTEHLAALPTVQEAVSRDRLLKMQYQTPGKARAERTVHPLGLVAKGTTWYLVADTPKGRRTFRVSRISDAVMLDRGFERPPRFNLAAAWKESTEAYRARPRYGTTLRADAVAADALRTWCRVVADAACSGGWVEMRVDFDDRDHASFIVLGLGAGVDVIEPPDLRRHVASTVALVLARLRDAHDPPRK